MSLWGSQRLLGVMSLAMGIHILNISIDPPDDQPYWIAEDLSVNETETIVEMVLENVLNFVDIVPEHEDHNDHQKAHSLVHISHNYVAQPMTIVPRCTMSIRNQYFVTDDRQNYLCPNLIKTPPPKV